MNAKEAGKPAGPIGGEQSGRIIGVDEIFGRGPHIERAKHSRLDRDFPLAVQRSRIPIERERFSEISRASPSRSEPARDTTVRNGKMRPPGIGMERRKEETMREKLWLDLGHFLLDGFWSG